MGYYQQADAGKVAIMDMGADHFCGAVVASQGSAGCEGPANAAGHQIDAKMQKIQTPVDPLEPMRSQLLYVLQSLHAMGFTQSLIVHIPSAGAS